MRSNVLFPDNVWLDFDGNGVTVKVSLNIPPEIKKYISPNNLYKGSKFWVYALKTHIPSKAITKNSLELVRDELLKRLMSNIRLIKSRHLEEESKKLYQVYPKQLSLYENI